VERGRILASVSLTSGGFQAAGVVTLSYRPWLSRDFPEEGENGKSFENCHQGKPLRQRCLQKTL